MDNMFNNNNRIININIVQWNCRSLLPKLSSFEQLLTQEKVHVAVLNETWLDPETSIRVRNYNMFRHDRDSAYGGVAILTHRTLQVQRCSVQHSNPGIEILFIKVHNCAFIENIITVYCAPEIRTSKLDWESFFSLSDSKTLFLGDYNGHHSNWSNKIDSRGTQILDVILDKNLFVLNDGTPTRFQLVNGNLRNSSPDISIITSDISMKFTWSVTKECLGSDHSIIKISSTIIVSPTICRKRNFKTADWKSYTSYLETMFDNISLPNDFQSSYDLFIDCINKAADQYIPFIKYCTQPNSKFKPQPYWDPNLSKSVAERRLALAKFRHNPTPQNLDILKNKIAESQTQIRKAKSKSWHKFCSSVDEVTSAKDMWNKMKWLKGYKSPRNYINQDSASRLLHSLTPDYATPPKPIFTSNNPSIEIPITLNELKLNIKDKDTSPGSDDISFSMIKNLPDSGKLVLIKLYNNFLTNSFVPKQWQEISIYPILKPGRDPLLPSSLRPISLMSCICKILHSIINKRIEWFMENNKIFKSHVIGFRKYHSTVDNLSTLVTDIQISFCKNKLTLGCFVDIENAYNNVDITVMIRILDQLGIGNKMCKYIWQFLSERTLKINVNGTYITRNSGIGLAQGDPFSPLLFNIATHNICKTNQDIKFSQYADDIILYTAQRNIETATLKLQKQLNKIIVSLNQLGLDISPHKSKVCIFKKRPPRLQDYQVNIKINNIILENVQNVKYLGLWLDSSLRWGKHINETREKVSKFLNIFKALSGPGWGIHPKHLRRLYIAIMRSRMDYASFLYDDSNKTHLHKLEIIQNQAMRIIGGFIRSTPVHVMQCELGLPPLNIRRSFLAGKYILKSKAIQDNRLIESLKILTPLCQTFWRRKNEPLLIKTFKKFKDFPIYVSECLDMFNLDRWMSSYELNNMIGCSIDAVTDPKRQYNHQLLKQICIEMIDNTFCNYYKIYTDGSKDGQGTGAAFYDIQTDQSMKFQFCHDICIMNAELIAIAEALSYIQSIECDKFVVLTDSKSSLQHIARCTSTSRGVPIAYTIIDVLTKLKDGSKTVVLQWIPSHVGISGNEKADELAKQAINDGVPTSRLPYFSDCIYIIKRACLDMWKEFFDERSRHKGIWYRTMQQEPMNCPWINNCSMNRINVITAMRLRSGHVPYNKFAFLMKKVSTPNCLECEVVEDAYHALMECVRNDSIRQQILDFKFWQIGGCNSVLAFPNSDTARSLYNLINFYNKVR